jgi:hypothetical protein
MSGSVSMAPASQCKVGSCAYFPAVPTHRSLSPHSYGQYGAITFATWFNPGLASDNWARLFDFNTAIQTDIVLTRHGSSWKLLFWLRTQDSAGKHRMFTLIVNTKMLSFGIVFGVKGRNCAG